MTDTSEHPAKIRILVLDEQSLLRYGISTYLNFSAGHGGVRRRGQHNRRGE
jgi:hypothetical protein